MKKYDLSILVPARNEEFLSLTVKDFLKNKRGNTEMIIVLDGAWSDPPVEDHQDIVLIYLPQSIGQRAAQNLACKLSTAKYVAKTDAHVAFDEGFDIKMLEAFKESGDDTVMVPIMRNLHIFNWKCKNCGMRIYQGPKPDMCRNETCTFDKQSFEREIVWIPKKSPQSSAYRFNKNLQFKYFPELKRVQPTTGLAETMSLQGSFFMCTRKNYWKYELCDESWGSWGQQGSEVALKAWLGGLKVLCNKDTWYAHLFRTQKGFDHPFNIGNSQNNARKICRDIFYNNKWDKQIHPLSWLLEKFWKQIKQVKDTENWSEADIAEQKERERHHPKFGVNATTQSPEKVDTTTIEPLKDPKNIKQPLEAQNGLKTNISYAKIVSSEPTKGILFYTDNQLQLKLAHAVQKRLRDISKELDIPITSVSLKKMDKMGYNIHLNLERGKITYYKQILAGLKASNADIIYFTEHDCLYHKSNFTFIPKKKDMFYYNVNWYKIRLADGFAVGWQAPQVSGLCGYRQHLLDFYRKRLEEIKQDTGNRNYEPGGRDKNLFQVWKSEVAYLDIRHSGTMTGDKWSIDDFRDISTCVNWKECNVKDIKGWEGLII